MTSRTSSLSVILLRLSQSRLIPTVLPSEMRVASKTHTFYWRFELGVSGTRSPSTYQRQMAILRFICRSPRHPPRRRPIRLVSRPYAIAPFLEPGVVLDPGKLELESASTRTGRAPLVPRAVAVGARGHPERRLCCQVGGNDGVGSTGIESLNRYQEGRAIVGHGIVLHIRNNCLGRCVNDMRAPSG